MDTDAWWGGQFYEKFEENKKVLRHEVKRVREGETGKEEVVNDVIGRLLLESCDLGKV